MTEQMLKAVLETAQAKMDKEGWSQLPEGRSMTLHAGHDGVPLTVSKVEAVATSNGILRARSAKGEVVMLAIDDVFAATLDGGGSAATGGAKRAGFLGG